MDVESRLDLFLRPPTNEILTLSRLRDYIERGVDLRHYIGFEISGFMHIGTGLVPIHKVVDLQLAGVETIIFLGDYHSWINRKLGGDLDRIKKVAGGYYVDVFSRMINSLGGDPSKTRFILASEFYEEFGLKYFENFLSVSMSTSLSRVRRSISILGRKMGESVNFGQLVYVPMQVADIFSLGVNIAHGGMDQRKAHVIAINLGDRFGYKPVALHHNLVLGIGLTREDADKIRVARESGDRDRFVDTVLNIKMSKSIPETAIFLHDSKEEIMKKVRMAYCPPDDTEVNPVFSMLENAVYPYLIRKNQGFRVVNMKTGSETIYVSLDDVKRDYLAGKLHPLDLKNAVSEYLWLMIKPVSEYLRYGYGKRYIEELESLGITR
ncbi:MAG TPA: tyrosine--tRNA ligase [Thermoprotei archaeon]|nr:tyrosine--tRNA ligase [Thermoprotei archaeon]